MLKASQKKEDGKIYLDKMRQYGDHIRETCLPKPSQKKKLELEMAMRNRKCSFAR